MKKFFGFLLGAGAGVFGSLLRTALAALGGYLISKGYADESTVASLTEQLAGAGVAILAVIGSYLNNQKVEEKVITDIIQNR